MVCAKTTKQTRLTRWLVRRSHPANFCKMRFRTAKRLVFCGMSAAKNRWMLTPGRQHGERPQRGARAGGDRSGIGHLCNQLAWKCDKVLFSYMNLLKSTPSLISACPFMMVWLAPISAFPLRNAWVRIVEK